MVAVSGVIDGCRMYCMYVVTRSYKNIEIEPVLVRGVKVRQLAHSDIASYVA